MMTTLTPTPAGANDIDRGQCEYVLERVKGRRKEVLYALAAGDHPHEAAKQLGIANPTLDCYKTELLALCYNAWNLPTTYCLTYHFIREKFSWLTNTTEELVEIERKNRKEILERVKGRRKEVLYALAAGDHPHEAAKQLGIANSTLDCYKTELLALCYNAWNLPPKPCLTYHFIREKFGSYLPEIVQ